MTIEEKRKAVIEYCDSCEECEGCVLITGKEPPICTKVNFNYAPDAVIDDCYNIAFGGEQNVQRKEFTFTPLNSGTTPEEINHPDRYASGKFECIDVMLDVFGADAVKHFCILNAFKYIWRAEKKNGVEDIKKAVWYLNKFIELGGEE